MPSPSFHSHIETPTPSLQPQFNGSTQPHPSPRSASSHSWKSVFRFTNSSSKKMSINSAPLTVDTHSLPSSTNGSSTRTPITPNASLTPASLLSDQRSSYNSSNTQSSDSNGGTPSSRIHYPRPQNRTYPSYQQQQPKSTDALSVATSANSRVRTKSEKQRMALSRQPQARTKSQTANPSQASFNLPPIPSTSQPVGPSSPKSPKSMGASASRFIRRVASAPNAKGLFSLNSRLSSSTTKNGLLAPAAPVPPLPSVISSSLENGTDSLETLSSGSSRGLTSRPTRTLNGAHPSSRARASSGMAERPGKVPFRRTYSSNSIKVRKVSMMPQIDDKVAESRVFRWKLGHRVFSKSSCSVKGTSGGCILCGKRRQTNFLL